MKFFKSILSGGTFRDRAVAGLGATIGIFLASILCAMLPMPLEALPLIVGPIGASAVLVFAVPSSPLAQPWPVIGGSMIGALVGVIAQKTIGDSHMAAGVAVGAAIIIMALTRSLHPPGGATALTAVVGGEAIVEFGFSYVLVPIGANAAVLIASAILYHRFSGHRYPHKPIQINRPAPDMVRITEADVEAALREADESFDISRADVKALVLAAENHANKRHFGK